MSSAPLRPVASWFCPVPAADRTDSPPAAEPARAKERQKPRQPPPPRCARKSASALTDVLESPGMYNNIYEKAFIRILVQIVENRF